MSKPSNIKTFRTTILNRAKNYANESNRHGLRYITATGNIYEKIFWSVLCLACTVMAAVMMKLMADRFYDSPTITTIETTNYPITEVEFPAVTICDLNQFTSRSAKKMAEKFTSYGMNESIVKEFLSELRYTYHGYLANSEEEIKNISAVMDKLGYNLETLLFELVQPCEELVFVCYWLGEPRNCSDIFQNLKTAFGFCCSFNWRGEPFAEYSNLSIKSNFKVSSQVRGEPLYVNEANEALDNGLTVWIIQDTVDDFLRDKMYDGYLVWLHGPTPYPDNSLRRSYLKPNYEATFTLRPKVMDSSPNVRSLSVQQRKCFFPEENPLDMEENYSYEACKLEYKIQGYLRNCGCIPFFYPNKKKMRTCGFQDMDCLKKNGELENADAHLKDKNWTVGSSSHCLQTCNSVRYDWWLQTERIDFGANNELDHLKNQTYISVIFEDNVCIKYRTESLITWESLIASFGGLFGLFMGGSVVSLIEILYHFTYVFVKENRKQRAKRRQKRTKNRKRNTIAFIENGSDINQKISSNNDTGKCGSSSLGVIE